MTWSGIGRLILAGSLLVAIAAACSSSESRALREQGGAAGEAGAGGASPDGTGGLRGGSHQSGDDAAGATTDQGGNASGANAGGDENAGAHALGAAAGEGGVGGAVDFGEPRQVTSFGCFLHSGDGGDLLANGEIAVNVSNPVYSAACDSTWISSNADAFAPEQVPTTLVTRRSFVIDPDLGPGDFTITFKADDAVDFLLNGHLILGCSPPPGDAALCQQVCNTSPIPAEAFNPPGQPNKLEARLINTQSVPAADGNFGYTALNYSMCVSAAP